MGIPSTITTTLLRTSLVANCIFSAVCALAFLMWAPTVAELVGRSVGEIRILGVSLLVFAAGLVGLVAHRVLPKTPVIAVIAGDVCWVLGSSLVIRTGAFTPMGDSVAAVVAAIIAILAALQIVGLIGPRRVGYFAIAGGVLTAAGFLRAANLPGDLRRPELRRSAIPTERLHKGRELLREAANRHGYSAWVRQRAFEFEGTDRWAGLGKNRGWWPLPVQKLKMVGAASTFTSRVELLDGPRAGEVWGLQAWRPYRIVNGSEPQAGPDRATQFYLPALHYFHELPFRICEAPDVAYAGSDSLLGRAYDIVFATWGGFEPHPGADQYELWISRDTGLIELVYYTVREGGPSAAGTIFYEDYRKIGGVQVAFRQTVTPTRPAQSRLPLDEHFFHQLRLTSAAWLDLEPAVLRPFHDVAERGDWKPRSSVPQPAALYIDIILDEPLYVGGLLQTVPKPKFGTIVKGTPHGTT